jgi:hypothetical protein
MLLKEFKIFSFVADVVLFFKFFLKGYSKNSYYRIMHRIGGKFLIIIEEELTCESVGGNGAEQISGQVQDF